MQISFVIYVYVEMQFLFDYTARNTQPDLLRILVRRMSAARIGGDISMEVSSKDTQRIE